MPDGPNAVFQALGRAAGATGRNPNAQGTPGPAGDVAAGLGVAAGQASANEHEPIPLSMTPQELAAFAGTPPRLVRALNTTPVVDAKTLPLYAEFKQLKGDIDLDFAAPGALEVRYLIRHIHDRLTTPFVDMQGRAIGGSPWLGPDGGATLGEQPSTDEHWARRVAEALSLLPYMLPVTAYAGFHNPKLTDEHLLYKLQGDAPTGDHAYPLALECQQSVTFAAISRGFDIELKLDQGQHPTDGDGIRRPRLKTLFSAGPSENVVKAMTPSAEVSWQSRDKGTTTLNKLDAGFGPGSAFTFNRSVLDPPGTPYKQTAAQNPHTAFVIRSRRDDQGTLRTVQFFDVGGMNVPETPHPAIEKGIAPESVYAYEYPWSTSGQAGAKGPYAGHAQLAPSNDTAWRGIFRLQDARPLGLARLVLARRHNAAQGRAVDLQKDPPSEWLLYASPMMLMYEDNPDPFAQPANFALTRYAWSLRDMPGREHVQAIWQITVPRSVFADAMAYGLGPAGNRTPTTRATTLAQMLADVAARKPAWNIKLDGTKALTLNQEVFGLIDLSAKPDGQVIVYDVVRSDYKTAAVTTLARDGGNNQIAGAYALGHFPWGKPTAAADIDLTTLTDVPDSFKPVPPPPPPPDPDDPYGD